MARVTGKSPVATGPGITVTVVSAVNSVLDDLQDVTITGPTAGQALIRNAGNTGWVNGSAGGSGSNPPTGAAGGDLSGTYPNPTVAASHSGSTHAAAISTAEAFATAAVAAHAATLHGDTVIRQYIPAASMWPTTTSGCNGPLKIETTTNKSNRLVLGFPTGSTTRAEFEIGAPSNWDGGTWTAEFDWETDAGTSNSVTWGLMGRVFKDGDASDAAMGTSQTVSDAASGTAYQKRISAATPAVTLAGSPTNGSTRQAIHFRVIRNGGTDTLAGNAYLHGIWLTGTHT